MKRLHKKIGVGVLVAGLLMGGVGGLSGSVAHGYSGEVKIEESLLKKAKDKEKLLKDVFELGVESGFDIVEVGKGEEVLDLFSVNSKKQLRDVVMNFGNYNEFKSFIEVVKKSGLYKHSFLKVKIEGLSLLLVFF